MKGTNIINKIINIKYCLMKYCNKANNEVNRIIK